MASVVTASSFMRDWGAHIVSSATCVVMSDHAPKRPRWVVDEQHVKPYRSPTKALLIKSGMNTLFLAHAYLSDTLHTISAYAPR